MVKRHLLIAGLAAGAVAQQLQPTPPLTLPESMRKAFENGFANTNIRDLPRPGSILHLTAPNGPVARCASMRIIFPPADFNSKMPVIKPGDVDAKMPIIKGIPACDELARK